VPGNRRDRIDVILTNDSTTLAPRLTLYKADKSRLDSVYNSTDGADLSYTLTAQPNTRYYVGVAPYKGRGSYRLTVRAQNAYDQYEPNDDILNSSPIVIGTAIEANILDAADWDFYHFETKNVAKVVVSLENRSTTLAPRITAYKPDKSQLGTMYNSTNGANLSYAFAVQSNSRYYFSVGPYNGHGKYALTVQPE
jgi:hypothetical protein